MLKCDMVFHQFQFDSDDTYSLLAFGGGALVAVWLASAVVGAIDSIPVVSTRFSVDLYTYTSSCRLGISLTKRWF